MQNLQSIHPFFLEITFLGVKILWSKMYVLKLKLDRKLHINAI